MIERRRRRRQWWQWWRQLPRWYDLLLLLLLLSWLLYWRSIGPDLAHRVHDVEHGADNHDERDAVQHCKVAIARSLLNANAF